MGSVGELGRIRSDLPTKALVLLMPVHRVDRNEEGKDAGAFDVPEELKAEPFPLVRPLDNARNVGDNEGSVSAERHHAEIWRESREGVVGDLRPGRRND